MSHDPQDEDGDRAHKHIQDLIGANMPDDSIEALAMRKFVGLFAHMYFHIRLPELAERTQAAEELLAEVAFWRAMHQFEADVRLGKLHLESPGDADKH